MRPLPLAALRAALLNACLGIVWTYSHSVGHTVWKIFFENIVHCNRSLVLEGGQLARREPTLWGDRTLIY